MSSRNVSRRDVPIACNARPISVARAVRATNTGSAPPDVAEASRSRSMSVSESRSVLTPACPASSGDSASAR